MNPSQLLVLVPELLVVVIGLLLTLQARLGGWRLLTLVAALLAGVAAGLEVWQGATLISIVPGLYVQDRFALCAKAALLAGLFALLVVAPLEEGRGARGLPLAALATLGGMVALSSPSLPLLWAAASVAFLAGVAAGSPRLGELGRSVLGLVGAAVVLSGVGVLALCLIGHTTSLDGLRQALERDGGGTAAGLITMLAASGLLLPLLLLPARAWHGASGTAVGEAVLGAIVSGSALLVGSRLLAAGFPLGPTWGPYLAVLAAVGAVVFGLLAISSGSPRQLVAWLVCGQAAWAMAALGAHDRLGTAGTIYLVGCFTVAAAAAPLMVATLPETGQGLQGMAARQPWRGVGLTLVLLSLAGAPPLGGFFGEISIAAALVDARLTWLLGATLFGGALCVWAVLRLLIRAWLDPVQEDAHHHASSASVLHTAATLVGLLVLAYGLFAYPIQGLAIQGAEAIGLLR
ncbi:MAG TPA: proton-conducting transporter membrane subunit [Candidatus Dormibacteraeota bacterium]|nr:proton-conducting transporter membrane subunit [Candidatus Dormibacteraeota bacterium]